ncbi:MAG: DUF1501 domain-containing protein [Acidiferrobacterales bacterium]
MKRRNFLKLASLAPLNLTWPTLVASAGKPRWDRVLVLLELKGGNDGLNTVVPYSEPQYYRLRPQLAVARDGVLQLSEQLGLNPVLRPLLPVWEAGELGVVLGVGYAKPNRSHFRSIEIWETGANSDEVLQQGWIARLFAETSPPETSAADGIVIGRAAGPLHGPHVRNIIMRDAQHFVRQAHTLTQPVSTTGNATLSHLLDVQKDLYQAASTLRQRLAQMPALEVMFPKTRIGRQFETAAQLLVSAVPVPVIKLSHGSFDTHSQQRRQHDRLLSELADALRVFRAAMQTAGLWDQVLVLTYSEFGRRAAENGSRGTDHGTAAPHFLLGGRVKGGFYGKQPALTSLRDGDLQHHVDYRSLYATVTRYWWDLRHDSFLRRYPPIDCLDTLS